MKINSSLSSPITAINPPVGWVRMSFSRSGTLGRPSAVEEPFAPRLTRPVALIRRRCPRRTTRPLLVQPFVELSARTFTLTLKNCGGVGFAEVFGLVVWLGGGLFGRVLFVRVFDGG